MSFDGYIGCIRYRTEEATDRVLRPTGRGRHSANHRVLKVGKTEAAASLNRLKGKGRKREDFDLVLNCAPPLHGSPPMGWDGEALSKSRVKHTSPIRPGTRELSARFRFLFDEPRLGATAEISVAPGIMRSLRRLPASTMTGRATRRKHGVRTG